LGDLTYDNNCSSGNSSSSSNRNTSKLAHTGLTVDSLQLTFLPTLKSLEIKTRPYIKNLTRSNLDIVP